jgi:hypothetical protein
VRLPLALAFGTSLTQGHLRGMQQAESTERCANGPARASGASRHLPKLHSAKRLPGSGDGRGPSQVTRSIRIGKTAETLRRLLVYLGARPEQLADFDSALQRSGQGTVKLTIQPSRKNLPLSDTSLIR